MAPPGAQLLFLHGRLLISEDRGDLHRLDFPSNLRTSLGLLSDHLPGEQEVLTINGTPQTSSLLANLSDTIPLLRLTLEIEAILMAPCCF